MKTTISLTILIGIILLISAFAPLAINAKVDMAPRIRNQTASTSTNWSGYAVDSSKGSVSDVKGSWTVQEVAGSGTAYSSFWIGIDGDNSNTVEQIGTDSDLINGVPQYYAWYEMYPKNSYIINQPVSPGDSISAQVEFIGSNNFLLTISDSNNKKQNWSFSITLSSGSAKRTSAEWIAEAPWQGGVLPLADFGLVTFKGCTATIGTTTGSIGSFSNYDQINMVTSSGALKASTGSLTKAGNNFAIRWVNS